jgi:hypothetical protein
MWSRFLRASYSKTTALARKDSNCKYRPVLSSEKTPHINISTLSVRNTNLIMGSRLVSDTKQTGRLTVCSNKALTLTFDSRLTNDRTISSSETTHQKNRRALTQLQISGHEPHAGVDTLTHGLTARQAKCDFDLPTNQNFGLRELSDRRV